MTSISLIRYLSTSSFTVNDFHAPDVARMTLFIFGNFWLYLSKITNPQVCKLIPYRIPVSCTISLEIKGNPPASDEVTELLLIASSSVHSGNPETNHSSILWIALFILIPYPDIFCSIFFPVSLSFSSLSS